MNKNSKFKIHRDSEILEYEGKIEFTKELIDFFEEERKKSERERKSDKRHIAYENIDWDNVNSIVGQRTSSLEDEVYTNILVKHIYDILDNLTEIEKRRFVLNKFAGLTAVQIANLEEVSAKRVEKSIANAKKKIIKNIGEFI